MKTSILSIFALALLAVSNAQAFVYSYSYTFGNGMTASGSFSGTENGAVIENVSDISLVLNGNQVPGNIYLAGWGPSGWGASYSLSFDPTLNNFVFINSDLLHGDYSYTGYFYNLNPSMGSTCSGYWQDQSVQAVAYDTPVSGGSWTLARQSAAAAVPEAGAGLPLLGAAAGLMVWLRRKLR